MIKATLSGHAIMLTADADAAIAAARIPGATRNARMPPLTWTLPFNLDSIAELRAVCDAGVDERIEGGDKW